MIRFGSGPVTMMLGLILATGSAVPIIARCGGTGVLAKGSGGTHSVGETKVSPAVAKARDLESELERLRTERILWDAERALALTEKAYDAGCQREFLETLLERRGALQRCDGLMDMVIFALSCVTVYNSAPESEWKSFAPIFRLQPVVGVNGRKGWRIIRENCVPFGLEAESPPSHGDCIPSHPHLPGSAGTGFATQIGIDAIRRRSQGLVPDAGVATAAPL